MDNKRKITPHRFIILALLVLTTAMLEAQPKVGDFQLGGSLSFNRQRGQLPTDPANGTETKNLFRLAPQIGAFLSKRWEGGFYTLVEYEGTSSSFTLKDSAGRTFSSENKSFELQLEFGFFVKYYYPISPKFYWVNSIQPNWGTFTNGDRLSALFESDKPQQNRERFIATRWITQLQYFAKPNLSVSIGFNPVNYTYTYNTIVRSNQPDSKERGHSISFNNIARGLFIGVNLLIISDDEE